MASLVEEYRKQINGHLDEHFRKLSHTNQLLTELVEAGEDSLTAYVYRDLAVNLSLSGGAVTGSVALESVPPGTLWLVTLINVTQGTAGNCDVYADAVTAPGLRWHFPPAPAAPATPLVSVEDSGGLIFLRERQQLIFNFTNQPANQILGAAVQVKQYLVPPTKTAHGGQFEDTDGTPLHQLDPPPNY